MKQTRRDTVTGDITLDYFSQRFSEGWRIATIEWVRDRNVDEQTVTGSTAEAASDVAVPYGLQIAGAGTLEEHPVETTVLLLILEEIIREKRMGEIAAELNHRGYRTREGSQWGPTAVFNLLPRIIEAGPSMLKSAAWHQRRANISPDPPQLQ